jgi:hypothetical protein
VKQLLFLNSEWKTLPFAYPGVIFCKENQLKVRSKGEKERTKVRKVEKEENENTRVVRKVR